MLSEDRDGRKGEATGFAGERIDTDDDDGFRRRRRLINGGRMSPVLMTTKETKNVESGRTRRTTVLARSVVDLLVESQLSRGHESQRTLAALERSFLGVTSSDMLLQISRRLEARFAVSA